VGDGDYAGEFDPEWFNFETFLHVEEPRHKELSEYGLAKYRKIWEDLQTMDREEFEKAGHYPAGQSGVTWEQWSPKYFRHFWYGESGINNLKRWKEQPPHWSVAESRWLY
jgi:hypothetical protein